MAHNTSIFTLTSPEFTEGVTLDSSYQLDRDNQSPELRWQHAPAGTRSFAVAEHDPDAATGGAGWWHWMMVGIPASAQGLARNAGAADGSHLPAGASQMRNDRSEVGYMGCYPPVGDPAHRYIFTVYALDTDDLAIPANASTSQAGALIHEHTLAKAQLTVYYAR